CEQALRTVLSAQCVQFLAQLFAESRDDVAAVRAPPPVAPVAPVAPAAPAAAYLCMPDLCVRSCTGSATCCRRRSRTTRPSTSAPTQRTSETESGGSTRSHRQRWI